MFFSDLLKAFYTKIELNLSALKSLNIFNNNYSRFKDKIMGGSGG